MLNDDLSVWNLLLMFLLVSVTVIGIGAFVVSEITRAITDTSLPLFKHHWKRMTGICYCEIMEVDCND